MSRGFALALAAASSLTLAAAAPAQAQAPKPAPEPAPIAAPMPKAPAGPTTAAASADSVFVAKAAEAGAKEVDLAKLGAAKATNTDVKAFAQRLVQDHTAVNTELAALAKSKDLKIRASAKPQTELAKLSGAAFDKAFVALMVKEHEAAIALFEGESRDGRDAEVKEWAAKQLPALREHLTQAKSLKTKES
jgi:putative membrane protein